MILVSTLNHDLETLAVVLGYTSFIYRLRHCSVSANRIPGALDFRSL